MPHAVPRRSSVPHPQVVGRKYVRLYDARYSSELHPYPQATITSNSSQVCVPARVCV